MITPAQLHHAAGHDSRPHATATAIGTGENSGRRLLEYRIVRDHRVLSEWDGAARHIELPAPLPGQGMALLVQSAGLRILGAADLPA